MADHDPITVALFWSRVKTGGPRQCWTWGGRRVRDYGSWRGKKAHRVAFELVHGSLSDGQVVRHTCDNPGCVNPAHLLAGSQADNVADAVARGRIARGARHGRAKLSEAQVQAIKDNPGGQSIREMADAMHLPYHTVYDVVRGRNWGEPGARVRIMRTQGA